MENLNNEYVINNNSRKFREGYSVKLNPLNQSVQLERNNDKKSNMNQNIFDEKDDTNELKISKISFRSSSKFSDKFKPDKPISKNIDQNIPTISRGFDFHSSISLLSKRS